MHQHIPLLKERAKSWATRSINIRLLAEPNLRPSTPQAAQPHSEVW